MLPRFIPLLFCLLVTGCKLNISYVGEGIIQLADNKPLNTDCGPEADLCTSTGFNEKVTLSAFPEEGYRFAGWEGDCSGTETCTLTVGGTRNVKAFFEPATDSPNYFLLKPDNSIFFASPWPNDLRKDADGNLKVKHFPFEKDGAWAEQLVSMAENTPGFSTNGAIYLRTAKPSPHPFVDYLASDILLFPISNPDERIPVRVSTFTADSDLKRANLLAIIPQRTLQPNTQYGLVVTETFASFLRISRNPMLDRLLNEAVALSETETKLRNQLLLLEAPASRHGASIDSLAGFTVFTTQDTDRYLDLIRNTVNDWDTDFIRARRNIAFSIEDCNETDTRLFRMEFDFPSYLSGTPPFTGGGGSFVIENDKLVEQSSETFDLYAFIPCNSPHPIDKMGVVIEAAETASSSSLDANSGTGTIRLLLDAPYSQSQREPKLNSFIETILDLANISTTNVFETLSHFNPFNLRSNLGLHYQYAIDILFARAVATQLDALIPEPLTVSIDTSRIGYTGESFGAMAAMHSTLVNPDVSSLNLHELSRLSFRSVNHLIETNDYIPDELVNFMSSYAGVKLPAPEADPTFHLLQTVLEPLDLINFADRFDHIPMIVSMDEYEHPFHGGPSSYALLKELHNRIPFNPYFDYSFQDTNSVIEVIKDIEDFLEWEFEPREEFSLPINEGTPLRLLIADGESDDDACFHYEVFYHEMIDQRYQFTPPCIHD